MFIGRTKTVKSSPFSHFSMHERKIESDGAQAGEDKVWRYEERKKMGSKRQQGVKMRDHNTGGRKGQQRD